MGGEVVLLVGVGSTSMGEQRRARSERLGCSKTVWASMEMPDLCANDTNLIAATESPPYSKKLVSGVKSDCWESRT